MIKLFLKKNKKGFTLVELIVVIAIIGILAAVLIPQYSGFQDKARSTEALVHARQIATAGDGLIAEGKTYSATATTDAKKFDKDDVAQIAGVLNTKITAMDMDATKKLITFTYLHEKNGTTFTATRDSEGNISVTWP